MKWLLGGKNLLHMALFISVLWITPFAVANQPLDLVGKGKQLAQNCLACHSVQANAAHKLGPNLWGVVGRKVASAPGYDYSPAFLNTRGDWSQARLQAYLMAPERLIPNNRMAFAGMNQQDSEAIVAYLASLTSTRSHQEASSDYGGLALGPGRALVFQVCARCHSIMLVTQQSMDKAAWQEVLDIMVEDEGMDELNDEDYDLISQYLSRYYGLH